MDKEIYRQFCEIAGEGCVLVDEPMRRHTTFRIGGPADYLIRPETEEVLRKILALCAEEKLPYFILGNGSNLLVSDQGYRGVIIQIYKNFQQCVTEGNVIRAGAGILLSRLSAAAGEAGLTGLEFASGIPGTLGGAVFMNAGAYGGEMKDILSWADVLDEERKLRRLSAEELELGYRTSRVKKEGWIVTGAELKLKFGDPEKIREKIEELKAARTSKQPLEYPSAGSTFKRPEGYFAGKLIMDAGLRGFRVGGAQVSEKHCGFVINTGNATAADVRELMRQVQEKVWEKYQVRLEPEVRFLGDF
ncbi:MAG TPA: UDP-N-acetylmuramate dehydrogenase [Candidatus Scatomonas merdavium]|nr:UDP-N-acetylmuramate dehydrogenase [Candidatus Scatomonas merdavium]